MPDVTPYIEGMRRRMAEREECVREAKRRAREVLERIVPILSRLPGVTRILLYGSLAYRRFHERSDIDIAVEGARPEDLEALARSLETDSPFRLDIRPFEDFPHALQRLITEFGEILYDRSHDAPDPEDRD